jgi:glycosyltransferase involved in cell wall biosynthesis
MHVLEAAPLRRPINEAMEYGAVERIVAATCGELMKLDDHTTDLFALPGTSTGANAIKTVGSLAESLGQRYEVQGQAIVTAASSADIIHTHIFMSLHGICHALAGQNGGSGRNALPPIFTTIHGPAERTADLHRGFVESLGIRILALSEHQKQRLLAWGLPVEAVVPGGVDIDFYQPARVKPDEEYVLTLGRVVKEKGVDKAIDVAEAAGMPIVIAGPRVDDRPEDAEYFDRVVWPCINGETVRYAGPVNDLRKLELLQGAKAVIHLSQVDETFGLLPLEAQACGVPVLASPRGALPEIIEDGVTGFICDSDEAAIEALYKVGQLDSGHIRQRTVEQYSWRMATQKLIQVFGASIS